jgi:mRNA interferase MazF
VDLVKLPLRDEVWLVSLDPPVGSEMKKTRPCVIVSPDEVNRNLRTVLVAPMTTTERPYPTRVNMTFQSHRGHVALDQIRVVDKERIVRKLGSINPKTAKSISLVLVELFFRSSNKQLSPISGM